MWRDWCGGWMGLSRFVFGGEALIPFVNVAAHASIVFILIGAGALVASAG